MLEVQRGADQRSVRAAYVRAIKAHSPERDPEGFKRVRAAYELLRAGTVLSIGAVAPMQMADAAMASSSVHVITGPSLPPVASDPLQAFRERVWSSDDPAVREAAAGEAVARFGSADAYWLLLEALEESGDDGAMVAAARRALAEGHGAAFVSFLARRFPTALTEAELDTWRSSMHAALDDTWTELAKAYLERGRADEAASLITRALERARRDPLAPRASKWWVTTLVLSLVERGATAQAVAAFHLPRPCTQRTREAANSAFRARRWRAS